MSLQFIFGGSGSGKTGRLYQDLIEMSIREPDLRYFAIVPEQFTMQTQKEIVTLHPNHGVMNIDIVSFQRLAYRIFEEMAVEPLSVLDDMGKTMILRKVAAGKRRDLGLFGSQLDKPGFVDKLKSMLSELYQYGVTPELLEKQMEETKSYMLRQKLSDLAVLYRGFKEYIEGRFITSEEILDVLCRLLPKSQLIRGSIVTLDGYTGFTPVQYRILELLLLYCKKVVVTVTIDPAANPYKESSPQNLFHMSKHTVCRLVDLSAKAGVTKEEDICLDRRPLIRFRNSPALNFLEQNLYRYKSPVYQEDQDQIRIYQAVNPLKEVEFVVNQILYFVQREGYRYREIAVVTGDLPGYANEIIHQFEQNGIPYFLDQKKNVLGNPMTEFIRSALEILKKNFSYESVFRYLRTGLTDTDREEIDRLENYAVALGIRSFKRWDQPWEYTYRGGEEINLELLNQSRLQVIAPLKKLREAFRKEKVTVKEMTKALVDLLTDLQIEQKMRDYEAYFSELGDQMMAKEYSQVYRLIIELFDKLVRLLGDETVSRKEYGDILDAGFEEIEVGFIPATVDRLSVGDITRTRLDHIRLLFFVGVNDGIIPSFKESGGVLTDSERRFLKDNRMELAPTVREDSFMQRFYLYLMMTKPEERLILSYSAMSAEGKGLRPSVLIAQLKKMYAHLPVLEETDISLEVSGLLVGKRRLADGLRGYGREPKDGRFMELFRWFSKSPKEKEQLMKLLDGAFYTYEETGIGRTAAKALYGAVLSGSVTRLEKYAACAYAHFLSYGLELRERQEYELAAVDIGNLFHSAIDLFFREMKEQGKTWRDLPETDRKQMVKSCVGQVVSQYGNTIMESSARYGYLAGKVERITDRTVWALAEQLKKGDFEPAGFEISFSALDNLKAMKIPLSGEEALYLRGRIDRLDLYEDQDTVYVKIIDYKSGSTKFDLVDMYYGLQLQLVVYMDAVMEMEEKKHPDKQIMPAGIFYYNIDDPMVERKKEMDKEEVDRQILKQLKMNGLVNSTLEAISHLDNTIETESDVIPVALKNGLIQEAKSSVANEKRFENLRAYVNRKLKSMGKEILKGDVSVAPYKRGEKTACDYCPYHSVCGFDLKTEGFGYKRLKPLKPEEVWQDVDRAAKPVKAEETPDCDAGSTDGGGENTGEASGKDYKIEEGGQQTWR